MPVTDGPRRRPQADGDRDRLVVVEQQRRHRGAGAQPVAAGRPGQRLDRVAELAQALDVAADRPPDTSSRSASSLAGPVAACLQQRQQLEQAARGGLAHPPSLRN